MRHRFENRHHYKHAQAQQQHHGLLKFRSTGLVRGHILGRLHHAPTGQPSGHNQRNEQVDDGRQKHAFHHRQGGDLPANPEHGGGHIADRRPGAAGIGGDDDDAGKHQPVFPLIEQALHERNHHDSGGQIVQNGAQKKGSYPDHPHQHRQAGGGNTPRQHLKTVVRVDDLDDGHGANQEKNNLRRAGERFSQLGIDRARLGPGQGVHHPKRARAQQGSRRFVDAQRMLKNNSGVGEDKKERECERHLPKIT